MKPATQPRFEPKIVPAQTAAEAAAVEKRRKSARLGFKILQAVFVVVPIVVGFDKFFHLLVNWDQYLSAPARAFLGPYAHLFMRGAGVVEILAGIGMAIRPQIFSYVISAWLLGIVVNLLLTGAYFDIALRDFALALSTFALGHFSDSFQQGKKGTA
ncbi:MAG: hypothetical protein ACXWP5_07690 [Bdellovibrionota bacterium]